MSGRARSSGLLSAGTTTVSNTANTLSGVIVLSDGAMDDATITVYDHASAASGTVLAKLVATAAIGSNSLALATPIRAENGLTVVVAGTGTPTGIILYGA